MCGGTLKRKDIPRFQPGQLEAIAAILGDTTDGLTGGGWVNRCVNVSGGIFPLLG